MEYQKEYLENLGETEKSKNFLKKIISSKIIDKNSKKHMELFQINRWKYLRDCKRILDVGCGNGNFIRNIPKKQEVWGMDIVEEGVNTLIKKGFNAKKGDANKKFPFEKDFFDGVISSHVFEHLEDPSKAIKEIKRILKGHGTFVLITPNLSFKKFYEDYTHVKPYTPKSLKRLLKDFGFKNVKIVEGPGKSKIISGLFFFFPRTRFLMEKALGLISPFEYIAIAKNSK